MVVEPANNRQLPSVRGRWKNDVVHAEMSERVSTERLYRKSKTRPEEFSRQEKRELRHRNKFGETRAETYRKLKDDFRKGKLSRYRWRKFKHALNMGKKWNEYKDFKKYVRKGLKEISKNELKNVQKFVNIPESSWRRAQDIEEAEDRGLISGRNVVENLADMSREDVSILQDIGFEISVSDWKTTRRVRQAKAKGLVSERNGKLVVNKRKENLTNSEKRLLRDIGFDIQVNK